MQIKLAYGKMGLWLSLPDESRVKVIEPIYEPALPDPYAVLRQAFDKPINAPPLSTLAKRASRIGIIFNDITRPTPNELLLRAILDEMTGVPNEKITLFNALGTHRPNSAAELHSMLGEDIVRTFKIVQNDCTDTASQVYLGQTKRDHPIWLNRQLVDCDLIVLTGFIEPHFFAGFSGGGKAIMPGMAGLQTIMKNHGASMIAHVNATWGTTQGNPIWEEIQEIAALVPGTFLLNVTLNREKQITGVYAGHLQDAYVAGCNHVRATAMTPVQHLYDIAITTNSGYPLDLNLYQSVKGMSAASRIVRPGGAILMAAECWDGIPAHGRYAEILRRSPSPQAVLESILNAQEPIQDQWQAQIQAQIQMKADVYLYSAYLHSKELEGTHILPCDSIEETLDCLVKKYGGDVTIAVLPEGPQTVPFLVNSG